MRLTDEQTEELSGDADAEFVATFNADSVEVTHAGGNDIPVDDFLIDCDVDEPQLWGGYGSVGEGDSVTVDADGANRTIIVVHFGPYGSEEAFLRGEE